MLTTYSPTVNCIDHTPKLRYTTVTMHLSKLKEIKANPSYKGRMINTLVDAIEAGIDPMDATTLARLVQEAYNEGKHRKPSYIKHRFKRQYSWLLSQIMAS